MAHWKVKLESDDNTLSGLAQVYDTKEAQVTRDGVGWFLESIEFEFLSDHVEVKDKAAAMVNSMLTSGKIPGVDSGTGIEIGIIYRIHYDNSKTVYR